jgi:RND family efflux transporter MFP subunit
MQCMKGAVAVMILGVETMVGQQALETAVVVSRPVTRVVRLPGEFLPYERVDLHARVAGFVERVEVDRGSTVRTGQTLIVLSAPEMAAKLAEAEARARAAMSQRAEAEAKLVAAESAYQRLKLAAATPGAVAGLELIQAEKAVEAARALDQALDNSVRAAQAAAEALRELQRYLTVVAPFDGVITERFVHPGALVGPGSGAAEPLLRLEDNRRLRLVVYVPEAESGGIVIGARVPFAVAAFPAETFHGRVARLARSLDPKTRAMPVELDVDNADGRLAPGMYAEVDWPVRRPRASLLVPPSSVVTTTERSFVIRVREGKAEWVDVRRGQPAGDLVEVFGPLRPGDVVLRRGTDEIRPGSLVKVRKP